MRKNFTSEKFKIELDNLYKFNKINMLKSNANIM